MTEVPLFQIFSLRYISVLSFLIFAGCSPFKTMEEMKDTTKKMSDTTDEMGKDVKETKEISQQMKEQVEQTNQTALNTYNDLRSKDSADARVTFLKQMKEAKTIEAKISSAAKYFQSFEFQLWKDFSTDNEATLDALKEQAVSEFFRELSDLVKPDYMKKGKEYLGGLRSTPDFMNLFALSVTLHYKHISQERVTKETGRTSVSMLSIILEALEQGVSVKKGLIKVDDLPHYAKELLLFEDKAVYMLQLRHVSLAKMSLGKMTGLDITPMDIPFVDAETTGYLQKPKALWAETKMKFMDWDLDLAGMNEVEMNTVTRWLAESVSTQRKLMFLGVRPLVDQNLKDIFYHLKVNSGRRSEKTKQRMSQEKYLKDAVETYKRYLELGA